MDTSAAVLYSQYISST